MQTQTTTAKIKIEPKIFHTCLQVNNFNVFDELLDRVDITDWKNQKKLELLFQFHFPYIQTQPYITVERYEKVISVFNINLNGSCWGYTPLSHLAARLESYPNNKTLMSYLLSRPDVDVNRKERRSGLPVLQAVLYNLGKTDRISINFMNKLIKKGADINATDKDGETVLHRILDYGSYWSSSIINEHVINYLLFNTTFNVDKKDNNGRTILDAAEERIVREKERYDKAIKEKPYFYTPTKDGIEQAMKIRDLIQARMEGGI